ncbi:hypothetical protein OH77DRAFT_675755 [Trametes cingulata]|nr:hypothetical protein OH77DRAFT_675755 [Trametes cingulata]
MLLIQYNMICGEFSVCRLLSTMDVNGRMPRVRSLHAHALGSNLIAQMYIWTYKEPIGICSFPSTLPRVQYPPCPTHPGGYHISAAGAYHSKLGSPVALQHYSQIVTGLAHHGFLRRRKATRGTAEVTTLFASVGEAWKAVRPLQQVRCPRSRGLALVAVTIGADVGLARRVLRTPPRALQSFPRRLDYSGVRLANGTTQ